MFFLTWNTTDGQSEAFVPHGSTGTVVWRDDQSVCSSCGQPGDTSSCLAFPRPDNTTAIYSQINGFRTVFLPCRAGTDNVQVPTEYFVLVLGRHMKYSSCLFNSPHDSLDEAESNMLGK